MAIKSQSELRTAEAVEAGRQRAAREGMLLGIPVGRLGWFASLLMATAAGFAAFFAATFLGIMGLLVMDAAGHPADFALSYKRIGLPVGLTVGVVALGTLMTMWAKRKVRGGARTEAE